jgi:hypothetical protein
MKPDSRFCAKSDWSKFVHPFPVCSSSYSLAEFLSPVPCPCERIERGEGGKGKRKGKGAMSSRKGKEEKRGICFSSRGHCTEFVYALKTIARNDFAGKKEDFFAIGHTAEVGSAL